MPRARRKAADRRSGLPEERATARRLAESRPEAQAEGTRRRRIRLLLAVGLWIGTAALFLPLRHHDFIPMDDPVCVSENMFLEQGFTLSGLRHAFTGVYVANWQPLTMLSYALDYQLHGRAAGGYLMTNFLLHATTTLLLFLALERLTGALGRSAFVAAIFGIHPLHVESVAWVSERKDVLSGVFFAAILWAYAQQPKGRPRRAQQIAIFGLLALGLLAKSMLVTVPFVLLLLDFWPLERVPRERLQPLLRALGPLAREKLPLFALAAASSVVTYAVQRASGAVAPLEKLPLAARLLNIAPAYVAYLERAFWPTGLAIYYPLVPSDLSLLRAIAATFALGAATVGAFALRRRAPYLLVGWLWYLGMLVPVSGLVQVGGQSMADRYTYLPLIGVTLALAWGARDLAGPKRAAQVALGAVAALLIAASARASSLQIRTWRDGESVAEQALAVTHNNPRAHSMFASALGLQGRWSEARPQIEAAIALEPGLALHRGLLGLILQREGRPGDAVAAYRDAL
ncbi:MAG TPA: hypothetical protein DEP35_18110, partial [Deltaproteobacteria bacterium]|nr:hypothetical protein [Deltaproteobacteria bacterium]